MRSALRCRSRVSFTIASSRCARKASAPSTTCLHSRMSRWPTLGWPGPGRQSVDDFDRDAEQVPRAALGADVARSRRVGLELAPQPQDLRVDRSVVDVVAVQARQVEELVARKNAIRRPEEDHEQAELAIAERYGLALAVLQASRVEVQLPPVETIGTNAFRPTLLHF